MSIAAFALAAASISDPKKEDRKKLMPKRVYTAVRDLSLVPEPR